MGRPRIFLDFDETLFNTKGAVFSYFKEKYGVKLDSNQWYCGNQFYETINQQIENKISADTFWRDFADEFLASVERHKQVEAMPQMIPVVKELAEKYDLYVVTARQEEGKKSMFYLFERDIKGCINFAHFAWARSRKEKEYFSKKDFIQSRWGENVCYMDDNPNEIEEVDPFLPSFLFDPKGFHKETPFKRIESWEEFANKIL